MTQHLSFLSSDRGAADGEGGRGRQGRDSLPDPRRHEGTPAGGAEGGVPPPTPQAPDRVLRHNHLGRPQGPGEVFIPVFFDYNG